jgi:hypothetical protein
MSWPTSKANNLLARLGPPTLLTCSLLKGKSLSNLFGPSRVEAVKFIKSCAPFTNSHMFDLSDGSDSVGEPYSTPT